MKRFAYDFENELVNLEEEIRRLEGKDNLSPEEREHLKCLKEKLPELFSQTYGNLTPWQRVLLARHPYRPTSLFYLKRLFKEFKELKNLSGLPDDPAIICGFGYFKGLKVGVAAVEKGSDTRERQVRRFGMPLPEGYYKFIRFLETAESLQLPVITLVDTPGAFPGIEAEERGQALAIARSIQKMLSVKTRTVSVIIGEGGSGGAIALATADRVFVFENAYYSVISPEGCASILFHDEKYAPEAASALKLTAEDLYELGLIHGVIKEPEGSAYRDPNTAAKLLEEALLTALNELNKLDLERVISERFNFYLNLPKLRR